MELNSSNAGGREVAFTRREVEILNLASEGYLNKEITENLNIAETTVKRHRQNCMGKLGIKGKQAMNRFLMKSKEWYATKVPQKWYYNGTLVVFTF